MLPAALLLDLDGTLVDSEPFHAESIARFLHRRGMELTEDERAIVIGHAWQDIHAKLGVQARLGLDLDALRAGAIAEKPAMIAEGFGMTVLPGARELVALAQRLAIPVAIVSGSSRLEIEQALELLGFADALSFWIGAEDVVHGKPNPEGYLAAAARLGVPASGCVVFEDSSSGIAAGRAAGMKVVATTAAMPAPGHPGHHDAREAHRVLAGLEGLDEAFFRALMTSA